MITYNDTDTFFVQMKYIKDFLKDYSYIFTVRCEGESRWLAIKDGHFLCACIMPSEIVTANLFEALYKISSGMDRQLKKSVPNLSGVAVHPERNVLGHFQGRYQELEYEQMEV